MAAVLEQLEGLDATSLVDITAVATALGLGTSEHLDGPPLPGATGCCPGPAPARPVVDRLVAHFGGLQKLLAAGIDDLQAVDGVGELRGPHRP